MIEFNPEVTHVKFKCSKCGKNFSYQEHKEHQAGAFCGHCGEMHCSDCLSPLKTATGASLCLEGEWLSEAKLPLLAPEGSYFLINAAGEVLFRLTLDNSETPSLIANLFRFDRQVWDANYLEAIFVLRTYIKWDATSHLWFWGEDYNVSLREDENITEGNKDGYYMLPNFEDYIRYMQGLAFVAEIAMLHVEGIEEWSAGIQSVRDLNLLKDCVITTDPIPYLFGI